MIRFRQMQWLLSGNNMKVYLGTDHAGFALKEKVKTFLQEKGYDVFDCGAYEFQKDDDYPDYIGITAEKVVQDGSCKGIIFGGSGQGEAMVANKFKHIRCAVFYTRAIPVEAADVTGRTSDDPFEIVRLARLHNDANILSLSARFLAEEDALQAVQIFLETNYVQEERHERRIEKMKRIEGE